MPRLPLILGYLSAGHLQSDRHPCLPLSLSLIRTHHRRGRIQIFVGITFKDYIDMIYQELNLKR